MTRKKGIVFDDTIQALTVSCLRGLWLAHMVNRVY